MSKPLNLAGFKVGRLTVQYRAENTPQGKARWHCVCECGNEVDIISSRLKAGRTLSCGCLQKEAARRTLYIHGETGSRLHNIWKDMIRRCEQKSRPSFDYYGGRGITICPEWRNDFSCFKKWADENGYSDELSIDRIDNDKGYCPENCRWATPVEQSRNRRGRVMVDYDGRRMCLSAWCEELGLSYNVMRDRIVHGNWSPEKAFNTPIGGKTLGKE